MSIIEVTDIASRKFSGYEEPQYPSGMWVAHAIVTGNATGGDMTVQINIIPAASFRDSQYYSLEQFMATIDVAASQNGRLLMSNLDLGGSVSGQLYTLPLLLNSSGGASLRPSDIQSWLPLFLGQQSSFNSATSLSFSLDNDDGQIVMVQAQGYIWGPRSTAVPGGPQRPPTGLYKS